jgi:hypothetical protein
LFNVSAASKIKGSSKKPVAHLAQAAVIFYANSLFEWFADCYEIRPPKA